MKHLLNFKLFESKSEIPSDYIEFMEELEKFPLKDIFNSWFNVVEPKRTQRVYIKSGYLPSITYFEKLPSDSKWSYMFTGAGRTYGIQRGDLQDLFFFLMADAVKKSAPTYLQKKDVDRFIKDKTWFFENASENLREIYNRMKVEIAGDSGIVLDFSNLKIPAIDNLLKSGIINSVHRTDTGVISIQVTEGSVANKGNPVWKFMTDLIEKSLESVDYSVFHFSASKVSGISFYPKGMGISVRSSTRDLKIDVGVKSENEAKQEIEKLLRKYLMKNDLVFSHSLIPNDVTKLCNTLYHGFIESAFANADETSVISDYIKENPLDLWILDSDPELKAKVLKSTGLRDISRLSKVFRDKIY